MDVKERLQLTMKTKFKKGVLEKKIFKLTHKHDHALQTTVYKNTYPVVRL